MNPASDEARREVVEVCRALDAAGLMPNKSGNVSCRTTAGFLVTPSGVPYAEVTPALLVELPLDATQEPAVGPRPSSEWRMHRTIYQARPGVDAIVHTHSPRATALSCARRGIPPFHYMILLAGGDVRCADHATFGTQALASLLAGPAIHALGWRTLNLAALVPLALFAAALLAWPGQRSRNSRA